MSIVVMLEAEHEHLRRLLDLVQRELARLDDADTRGSELLRDEPFQHRRLLHRLGLRGRSLDLPCGLQLFQRPCRRRTGFLHEGRLMLSSPIL